MVTYKVIKREGSIITFDYWREGEGQKGTLTYNLETDERFVIEWAPEDKFRTYVDHAWDGLLSMVERNMDIKDEGNFAWY